MPVFKPVTTSEVAVPSEVDDQLALARFEVAHLYWKWSTGAPAGFASQESVIDVEPRVTVKPVGRHGPVVMRVAATVPADVKPDFSPRIQTV